MVGALSVVALKKWFRNLHLLNIHVMLLGQEGRLAAIDTVQEFLCELDIKPHMDLVKNKPERGFGLQVRCRDLDN